MYMCDCIHLESARKRVSSDCIKGEAFEGTYVSWGSIRRTRLQVSGDFILIDGECESK